MVGSSLLCQEFVDAKGNPLPQYFQPRPSNAVVADVKNDYGCDPLFSAASNLGPNNPALVTLIKQRQQQIAKFDHVSISQIPADAVTASGSGLDPDISPQNAAIQVDRVAAARHVSPAAIRALVSQYTQGRTLGFLGEPRVNVLTLNIALDQKYPVWHPSRAVTGDEGSSMRRRAGRCGVRPRGRRRQAPRVLIVEDEPALLRALRINLRARGYEVATASSGRDGARPRRAAATRTWSCSTSGCRTWTGVR